MTIDNAENAHGDQQPGLGTLEHVNPHALVLEANVRGDADLDADFVAASKSTGC